MSYTSAKAKYESKQASAAEDDEPRARKCIAEACPMAPGLSDGAGKGAHCAYHHGCHSEDLARVTSILNQHHDLRDVINHARRLAASSDIPHYRLQAEWRKLRDLLMFAGYANPPAASITHWIYACERMLAAYVFEMHKRNREPIQQSTETAAS